MKILIVDDEPAIADTLSYALRAEGFTVDCCTLGGEALRRLAADSVDFVVLDVGLPDMTGFDVCRALRRHSEVPVLFLTARADEVDRIVGLELGGDDYVTKPFSPREVASRIRAISRRLHPETRLATGEQAHSHPPRVLPAGRGQLGLLRETQKPAQFAVDPDGLRIAYHGQWLALTRYEYLLLALLLQKPGRILSRQQIMDTVWQDGGDSLERTVDTHIKTLRGKLRLIRDEEVILTYRGLGYSVAG